MKRDSRTPNVATLAVIALCSALCASVGFAAPASMADNCGQCHKSAPVSKQHPPVAASFTAQTCLLCHEAQPGDGFALAVHTGHPEKAFACAGCHGADVPAREKLDQLLQDPAP